MTARYINPYTDFGFKKLFGEEGSKDLLIDFLNAILPQERKIANLSLQNTERLAISPDDRKAMFDVYCVAESGERFIVEMQKAAQHYFRDRAVFYSTFAIQEQAEKGDWNFQLDSVYFVAILNFIYDRESDKQKFAREVSLKDQDGDEFYEKLHYFFFQMPLFTKQESELVTQRDKWFYFLRNLDSFADIPAILREPVFEQAFATAETTQLSREDRRRYEADLKVYRDNYAVMQTAELKGEARGEAKGRAEGETAKATEIAQNMKQEGLDIALIAKLTGLSESAIERL
jgi:predicted transposase/invertase (TIGR01784 family)